MGLFQWVVVCFVFIPFSVFEGVRFYLDLEHCRQEHAENAHLLQSDTCSSDNRLKFRKKRQLCEQAERENAVEPVMCAWRRLWKQSEVLRVWHMLTSSYLLIWGGAVIVFCFYIWTVYASHMKKWQTQTMLDTQSKMYRETLQHVSSSATLERPRIEEGGGPRPLKIIPNTHNKRLKYRDIV
jgi:hypothetical protein